MKTLLQARGISKRFGSLAVLDDASAAFGERMKVGMIGRNGAGKSTLCRILTGDEEPDDGEVVRSRDLRLGYLEQHDTWNPGEQVMDYLVRHTGREEWNVGKAAANFALKGALLEAPVDSLSGGFRTRVKLAAMVAMEPNFLLLDEPTNFLDLSTLLLLQEFLEEFTGGALLVSHDREFLKRTCDHTLALERGRLTLFPGPLETWFEFQQEQEALARRTNAVVQAKRAQLQEFVDRFGAKASKATQAKSKMKEMERLKSITIDHPLATAKIRLPKVEPRKGIAFDLEELEVGYPDRKVAAGIHLSLERGVRAAIVGDNGQGKTTLLRTLAEDLAPRAGRVRRGHGVEVSFYAQHVYQSLDTEDTVLSHLEKDAPFGQTRQDVLEMAGCFLFRGDDVHKPVSVLSGGERARLCLAGLLLRGRPALLLDEPTNHLDFETVEALGNALREFDGTCVFISHDRTFVSMVATEILEVGDGRVRRRAGSYEDYVDDLDKRMREERQWKAPQTSVSAAVVAAKPAGGAAEWAARKKARGERTRAEAAFKKAEERVRSLETERKALFDTLEADPTHANTEKYRRIHELEKLLAEAEDQWLAAQVKMEATKE